MAEFNVQAYLDANPDLPDTWTDAEAIAHYITFGFDEGRDVYWSATDYITLNPDLAGMTEAEAFSHWVVFGKDEGRVPWFQADEYIEANGDLAGMDAAQALSHWVNFGRDEGRIKGFDADGYIELNADLPTTWTYAEALNHYYQFGEGEGRAFDPYEEGTIAPPPDGTIVPVVDDNVTTLPIDTDGGTVTLTANDITVDGGAGTQVLRLTGDASTRIDLTRSDDQVEGIDLNGDGQIAANGVENDLSGAGIMTVSNFEVFDAYARNPVNEEDSDSNFFGDIDFDGTGFFGDGFNTDGNIYLGGLGVDQAFGGIGNDFIAGGGVAAGRFVWTTNELGNAVQVDTLTGLPVAPGALTNDSLSGGRNADFFYLELSALDPTDGNGTFVDGGSTWDNDPTQDSDWILLEVSDDNEPVTVNLGNNLFLPDPNSPVSFIPETEHLDASGDLYNFLNSFDAVLGGMRDFKDAHAADGKENSGIGSTGQMIVTGTVDTNIILGGYDNDTIFGAGGNDILFGGKLQYLLNYANNPNLVDANGGLDLNVTAVGTVNDGMDWIFGDQQNFVGGVAVEVGTGSDTILFEMDGGRYDGGGTLGTTGGAQLDAGGDTLFVTDFSMGRLQGQTWANELAQGSAAAQADALAALVTDATVRLDLGVGSGVFYRGYGGADELNNEIAAQNFTADQTNYAEDVARATVQDIEGVIATGLGDIDYDADGANTSEVVNDFQVNFGAVNADMDLRGFDGVNDDAAFGLTAAGALNTVFNRGDNTLYANTGNDILEGRGGNDLLSGGTGHDDFVFSLGALDDADTVHRQDDADRDGIWDGTFSQDYRVEGDPISADPSTITYTISDPEDVISVLFTLDGVALQAAGAGITGATNVDELATAVNTELAAIDASLSAAVDGDNLVVTDESGRAITQPSIAGDLDQADFTASAVVDNGTPVQATDEIDRIIMKAYANRATNLGVLDQEATLGRDAYAEDLVVGFDDDGSGNVTTTMAEDQTWAIQFQNLNPGDEVTVTINGVDFTRTVTAANANTDGFLPAFVNQINNQTFDVNTTAGQVTALWAVGTDAITAPNSVNEGVLYLSQAANGADGAEHVFMYEPTVAITNPNGAPGTAAVANVSDTSVELLGYDGRDNDINADTVLFVGNSGTTENYGRDAADPTDISAGSDYSWSVLATALAEVSGTLDGSDAIIVDTTGNGTLDTALHGDDLLIGAGVDDTINAGTGDDRIVGSLGTDTVDGGGNEAIGLTVNGVVQDALGSANYVDTLLFNEDDFGDGAQFVVAIGGVDATNGGTVEASVGGTSVGTTTYSNIELVRTLSNTAADTLDFATLSDEIAAITTAGATQALRDMIATEGVTIDYTNNAQITYDVDRNNDDDLGDANEVGNIASAVQGVENIIGGGANDTVILDESQSGATNTIDLAGNAANEGNLALGVDTVTFSHNNIWANGDANQTTFTIAPSAASTIVTQTGGVLENDTASDTLTNVEVVNVTNAANGLAQADTIDVSGLTDAIVNYGGALAVLDSLQPNGNGNDNTAALNDLTVINSGGIAEAGSGQGAEVLTITGATLMERVNGGDGDDRVVVANNMQDNAAVAVPVPPAVALPDLGFNSYLGDGEGPTAATDDALVIADPDYNGLYRFDLGDGSGDMLDYTNEAGDVAVVLATDDTSADRVMIDGNADGDLQNNVIGEGDRVDLVSNTEIYLGGAGVNRIDLSESTVATTVGFSYLVDLNGNPSPMSNGNEFIDPDGFNGPNDTDMLGIEVRDSGDGTIIYGQFIDDPNTTASLWTQVWGNDQAQTLIFTDNETGTVHQGWVQGGDNVIDYSALTAGTTLTINDTTDGGVLVPTFDAVDNKLQSVYASGVAGEDAVVIWRDANSGSGTATFIGSNETTDVIDMTGLAAVAPNGQHVANLIDQVVIEDETNTNPLNGNFTTNVQGFENVNGSAFADRIIGDGQDNTLNGNAGVDIIRGGGGADTIDTGTSAGGGDRVGYTRATDGNVADAVTTADADTIAVGGWTTGTDFIEFSGALQAALENNGTVHTGGAGSFDLNLDGIFVSTFPGVANDYDADTVTLADVAGAVGALVSEAQGDEAIFMISDANGDVGIYYFQSDTVGAADNAVTAADTLTLLGVEYNGAGVATTDIITRIGSGAGGETISLGDGSGAVGSGALGVHEIVYTNQNQSTLGSRDEIDEFNNTRDSIDLSALSLALAATDDGYNDLNANNIDDAIELIIATTPVSVDNASTLDNFFNDSVNDLDGDLTIDNVDRAVVVQQEANSDDYRIFVDMNRDGDWNQSDDLVFDITNEGEDDGAAGISGNDLAGWDVGDFIFA